jgi:hypothetical protein
VTARGSLTAAGGSSDPRGPCAPGFTISGSSPSARCSLGISVRRSSWATTPSPCRLAGSGHLAGDRVDRRLHARQTDGPPPPGTGDADPAPSSPHRVMQVGPLPGASLGTREERGEGRSGGEATVAETGRLQHGAATSLVAERWQEGPTGTPRREKYSGTKGSADRVVGPRTRSRPSQYGGTMDRRHGGPTAPRGPVGCDCDNRRADRAIGVRRLCVSWPEGVGPVRSCEGAGMSSIGAYAASGRRE